MVKTLLKEDIKKVKEKAEALKSKVAEGSTLCSKDSAEHQKRAFLDKILDIKKYNQNSGLLGDGTMYSGFRIPMQTEDGSENDSNIFLCSDGNICKFTNLSNVKIGGEKLVFRNWLENEDYQITKYGLELFLEGTKIDTAQLYGEIKDFVKEYVDFRDIREYDLLTCWTFHCFYINLIGTTAYVHLIGDTGTGKSQTMKFNKRITPKADYITSPSEATIYRGLARSQNTQFIDEFDKYQKEDKLMMIAILNNGITADGYVPRMAGKQKETRVKFPVFSPKMFAGNFEEFNQTFKSRTIDIWMIATLKKLKDADNMSKADIEKAEQIRNKLYIWALQNKDVVMQLYENRPYDRSSREDQALKPLYPIAKMMNIDKELLSFLKTRQEEKQTDEAVADRKYYLLDLLWKLAKTNKTIILKPVDFVKDWQQSLRDVGWKEEYLPSSKALGKDLKYLGLASGRNRDKKGVEYTLTEIQIVQTIQMKRYTAIFEESDLKYIKDILEVII